MGLAVTKELDSNRSHPVMGKPDLTLKQSVAPEPSRPRSTGLCLSGTLCCEHVPQDVGGFQTAPRATYNNHALKPRFVVRVMSVQLRQGRAISQEAGQRLRDADESNATSPEEAGAE